MEKFEVGNRVKVLNCSCDYASHNNCLNHGASNCINQLGTIGRIDGNYGRDTMVRFDCGEKCKFKLTELTKVNKMSIKERIEALNNGWDKPADDILMELKGDITDTYYRDILITQDPNYTDNYVQIWYGSSVKSSHASSKKFYFKTQCSKNRAFKDALLWLADKAGMLDPKEGDNVSVEVEGSKWEAKLIKKM